ncbi:hypothetical protein CN186_15745 [Sinorhizobium medicae]|uniref:GTA-gp10 family protein n=1 Tax=Sinorhizobium medicae TaxID=110321 RepID=UPI000FD81350|nr:GTA-gp10 family protein [Sinorhizobium medicae]RVI93685.1 hypothetical protein CN186_15745 [Sinorhizobium medicae]
MANPHRGSVAFNVGDRAYTLSFSINAICELEELLGQPVPQIAATLNKPEDIRMTTVRALIWAALRDYHEEADLKEAGAIASEAGMPAVMEAIGRAFQLAFPEAADNANPRKAPPRKPGRAA